MPEGEILYINSVGGFRVRKVKLEPMHPIIVRNRPDRQAHALDEKPVHSVLAPVWFTSMDDLLAATAPTDPVYVNKWGIVCADNAVWPLSPQSLDEYLPITSDSSSTDTEDQDQDQDQDQDSVPEGLPDLDRHSLDDLRSLKYQEYVEEATQRAMHDAERKDNRDGYLTVVNFTLGMVACLVLVLIAGIIAYYKWGPSNAPDATPPPTAALLMMLPVLGALNLRLRRPGNKPKQQQIPPPPDVSAPKKMKRPKLAKGDAWVTARVFDHPLLGGKIWQACLPYSVWMQHVSEACVFRPDIPRLKKMGAGMFAAIGSAILLGILYPVVGPIVSTIAMIPGAIIGAIVGWILGPGLFGNKPRIVVARIPDDNGTRQIIPIEHNYCRTVSTGEYLTNLENVLARLNASEGEEEDIYEPTVFRATTLYDDIAAQDEQAEVSSPSTKLQKIQIGMMALMAFGSVGLLFFIAMATTKP